MISGLFGDRGRAKILVKLAKQTVEIMTRMLHELPEGSPDRKLIEDHLNKRINALERYSMLARGESDDVERLMPTMRNYGTWKRSMENEIEEFSSSTQVFVWYLKEIQRQ